MNGRVIKRKLIFWYAVFWIMAAILLIKAASLSAEFVKVAFNS
jgi:hypothetical protein